MSITTCTPPAPPLQAQLIFDDGFESGRYEGKWKIHLDGKTALIEIVTASGQSRKYAAQMKTELSGGDRRAELVPLIDRFNWKDKYWVGLSILIKTPVEKAGIVHQHYSIPNNKNWKECNAGPNDAMSC